MLARVSGSAGEYFSLGAQARYQRVDRVAARLDAGHAGHAGRRDGAHVPVVRAACMTAQELAAALKLARGHPAPARRAVGIAWMLLAAWEPR